MFSFNAFIFNVFSLRIHVFTLSDLQEFHREVQLLFTKYLTFLYTYTLDSP